MKTDIYKVTTINDNNDEDIIVKMLIGIKALILSEKCEWIDEEGETEDGEKADILLKYTLFFEEEQSDMMYHQKLFLPKLVTKWITKSKSNIVINDIPFKNSS